MKGNPRLSRTQSGDAPFSPCAGDGNKGEPTHDKNAKKVCVTGEEGGWYAEVGVRAMHTTEKNIGKNIRALREKTGLTQDDLAARLFVTRQTVSNYETGRSRPDVEMLVRLSSVLGADVNDLIYGAPAPEKTCAQRVRLWTACAVCAVLAAVYAVILGAAETCAQHTYLAVLPAGVRIVPGAAVWALAGWCAVQAGAVCGIAKLPAKRPILRRAYMILLVLLCIEAVLALPWLALSLYSLATGTAMPQTVPVYGTVSGAIFLLGQRANAVHAVFGAALRILQGRE